jgi:hypothetical protein
MRAASRAFSLETDSRERLEIFVLAPLTWSGHHE